MSAEQALQIIQQSEIRVQIRTPLERMELNEEINVAPNRIQARTSS